MVVLGVGGGVGGRVLVVRGGVRLGVVVQRPARVDDVHDGADRGWSWPPARGP